MQLATGAALVAALLTGAQLYAADGITAARAHCRALAVSDWDRAQHECRGTASPASPGRPPG